MGNLQNWEMVMKYQRKNGSLFNSPSTTAAALNNLQNADCLNYLRSLLEKFGDAGASFMFVLISFSSLHIAKNTTTSFCDVQFQQFILWIYMHVFAWLTILKSWGLIDILGRKSEVCWMKHTGNLLVE